MSQFFNSINEIAKNYKPYDAWEEQQDDLIAKKIYLNKKTPLDKFEQSALEKKAQNIVRVSELMDMRSENNAQDVEMMTETTAGISTIAGVGLAEVGIVKYFNKKMAGTNANLKQLQKRMLYSQLGVLGTGFILAISFILWGNAKTKEASRLGRFQSKIHDLKDPKNFVQFTPEQIAEAEKIATTIPDEKERKGILKAIQNIKEMKKDTPLYKKYKKQQKNARTQVPTRALSKEELKEAKKDKELLLNVIKKINNTAEDYSENLENSFDTLEAVSFLATIPIKIGLNKIFDKLKLNIPKGQVSLGVALLFPIATSIWATVSQKKAARVGRYVAKQEILANPEILRTFSDEEMKSAEHIKTKKRKKGFWNKIKENMKFIPKYMKDNKAYNNYIKNERPKNEKLNKALLQVKVSEKQMNEAKHLQEKTFMSFDKMDEMSQRYSEDMEAAGEIGKKVVTTAFTVGGWGAVIGGLALFCKGKLPTHRIIKFLSNFTFKKSAPIRQTIDESYKIINGKKEFKQAFNRLLSPVGTKAEAQQALIESGIAENVIKKYPEILEFLNFETAVNRIKSFKMADIQPHLNDNPVAKWARNLILEIGVLTGKSKTPYKYYKEADEIGDMILTNMTGRKITNTYSRYKTLINSSIVASIPILGTIIGIPYAICTWLTNMQKKAGRIGIMQAMNDLDNPNLYVNNYAPKQEIQNAKKEENSKIQNQQKIIANFMARKNTEEKSA